MEDYYLLGIGIVGILFVYAIFFGLGPILTHVLIEKKPYPEKYDREYAGFWHRFAATLIDGLVLLVPTLLVIWIPFMGIVFSWLYFALFHSSKHQATLGMMALSIKIYNENEERISFGRATGRYFSTPLSALILCIGYFMIGWTLRKQGLHDKIARTIHLIEYNK